MILNGSGFVRTALSFLFAAAALLTSCSAFADDLSNPYADVRLSRLSYISGDVLFQRGDDEEWIPASVNVPLRPHDKLWSTGGARAELEFDDGSVIRLSENTSIDLLSLAPGNDQVQLTLGTATFVTGAFRRTGSSRLYFEVDTPQAAIVGNGLARFRVEVHEDGSTEITVREGKVEISTDEAPVAITKDQRVIIDSDENPKYSLESAGMKDDWDDWNDERDRQVAEAASIRYLPPDYSMGVSELDLYGSWRDVPEYGWVWTPQVAYDWVPYRAGRWVWIEPWGWTWVSYEPWGWVPYHYGRWIVISGSWVWVPGHRREVWSPGHVRFVEGANWIGWVPLAPGEVYYYRPGEIKRVRPDLRNYQVPGSVTVLPRQTFISGQPVAGRFNPPADPIRSGRLIAGPPSAVPTRDSLRPKPQEMANVEILPPRVVHRAVTYDHPIPSPPLKFENRIEQIKESVQHGQPPLIAKPQKEATPAPQLDQNRNREGIHKDIVVRKVFKEPVREFPRPAAPSSQEEMHPPKELPRETPGITPPARREQVRPHPVPSAPQKPAKPLYRTPPKPARQGEMR